MQLSNYSKEYIKEHMDDVNEFAQLVNVYGYDTYSTNTIATLYTVMKREIPRENSGHSGY